MTMREKIIDAIALAGTGRGARISPHVAADIADAVLDAMREPTDLMGAGLPADYRPGSHSATQIWQAMIDAALKDSA